MQPWVHDLAAFERFDAAERDRMIGRTRAGDVELSDAPLSAHVKRTAQEDFTPFRFTRPIGGGAYWCPPAAGSELERTAVRPHHGRR